MQNRGVVSATKQLTDFRQAFLGQFFGQVHGNLARSCNRRRTLFGIHVSDFDFVIISHGFLNVFDRNLPVLDGQQVAQRVSRELNRNVFLVKTRIRQYFTQSAFQLPDVGAHIFSHKKSDFFGHVGAFVARFGNQNSHTHFQFGGFNRHR